jgi:hypothetical protein
MAYDIVGEALDLVGADDSVGGNPVAKLRKPSNQRRLPLGFQSLAVGAGATVSIPVVIQNQAFRLEELIVPNAVAVDFTIEDLKVGNSTQFASSGSVPAAAFSELCARQINLKCATAQSGLSIILTVKNTNAAAKDFRAAGIGTALE